MTTLSLTDRVESGLRQDIMAGELAPSSPLRMAQLTRRYATGATPVREALSRLVSEGLVELTTNKGFRVPGVSRDDLLDIVAARTAVETEALRRSMAQGDDRWEAGIVAALHRYRRKVAGKNGPGFREDVELAHDELHTALLSACGSARLLSLSARLAVQHVRYQRICSLHDARMVEFLEHEHGELVELALSRDAERAVEMLRQHLLLIVEALDQGGLWAKLDSARR